jgi:hypothetical protein
MVKRSGAGVGRTLSMATVLTVLGLLSAGGAMAADKGNQSDNDAVAHSYCPSSTAPDVRKCGDTGSAGHEVGAVPHQHETPTEPEPTDAAPNGARRR